jgi:hypothetical protein
MDDSAKAYYRSHGIVPSAMSEAPELFFLTQKRAWLYKKLERVMDRLDGNDLPMYITDVYLFGSFLGAKTEPNDLDLLLLYDSNRTSELYEVREWGKDPHWCMRELRRSPARLRRSLKKNAERSVDISICPSLEEFQRDLAYPLPIYLRIWTRSDRNWRSKLACHFAERSSSGFRLEPGCPA